ncbi:phosphate ABC transporter permease PstA [Nocardioides jiangxiensis]|uniref:Phosphate transport system permease protein PstA n=1 Tax=Nocardioides jiangxiensis TaxID=3064524 RepID=A0ABT9B1R2_9ACTN|nr:phosphate ABC transporter permease PstA [Nocardioides sp. WY-20]MDO7868797.1 phosphate ABC transporter permease PstA [Nocardioides sp. WY-20]
MTAFAQVELTTGSTHLPVRDPHAPAPRPLATLGRPTAEDTFRSWGSLAGSAALAWLVCERLLPLPGVAWFLVVWFVLSVGLGALVALMRGGVPDMVDMVARRVILWAFLLIVGALVSVIGFVIVRGWHPLMHLNFWTDDMAGVGPKDGMDKGGVLHAIVGSLIELGIGLAITVPLGIGTAVFMNEIGGRFAAVVRTVVEAMTALPSIVAGLFVYTVWLLALGQQRSGLAASLAIAVMMLPIIARASDVVLRVVPGSLREASLALGSSRWKTVWHVVLPTARPGLATAVILGLARGVGETSPVLLTSGAANALTADPLKLMSSLPLYIFTLVRSGEPASIDRGFAGAAALLLLVLTLFVAARLIARPQSAKPRRRPVRALVRLTTRPFTLLRRTQVSGEADLNQETTR